MQKVDTLPPLPPRPGNGHKGLFGRVLVVGGHDEMLGAPVFAATAALRMGAGLVQIAVPKAQLPFALSITPELIGLALSGTSAKALLAAADRADAIAIGPGLGESPQARQHLRAIARLDKPIVVDADALNLLAKEKSWPKWFKARAVLTPHPGEMSRLARLFSPGDKTPADDPGRLSFAAQAARALGQVIVLKGAGTVITDGDRYAINNTGDSTLSKGGSGDILTGLIACLLAQHMSPFDAAHLAAHLHGRAGELAGKKFGQRSALAREIIDQIQGAIAER